MLEFQDQHAIVKLLTFMKESETAPILESMGKDGTPAARRVAAGAISDRLRSLPPNPVKPAPEKPEDAMEPAARRPRALPSPRSHRPKDGTHPPELRSDSPAFRSIPPETPNSPALAPPPF